MLTIKDVEDCLLNNVNLLSLELSWNKEMKEGNCKSEMSVCWTSMIQKWGTVNRKIYVTVYCKLCFVYKNEN